MPGCIKTPGATGGGAPGYMDIVEYICTVVGRCLCIAAQLSKKDCFISI